MKELPPSLVPAAIRDNPAWSLSAKLAAPWLLRDLDHAVFVATTGRTGTTTLAELFSHLPGFVSVHEPGQMLNGETMRAFNDGDRLALERAYYRRKLPNFLRRAAGHRGYFEANHAFIKTFADLAVQTFGDRMRVIYLTRDTDTVAASYFNRLPCRTDEHVSGHYADDFILDPRGEENCLKLRGEIEDADHRTAHFLWMVWYVYETEARASRFARRYPQVPVSHLRTEDLCDEEAVGRVLSELDLPTPQALTSRLGIRLNGNERPSHMPDGVDRAVVSRFHARCRSELRRMALDWASATAPRRGRGAVAAAPEPRFAAA